MCIYCKLTRIHSPHFYIQLFLRYYTQRSTRLLWLSGRMIATLVMNYEKSTAPMLVLSHEPSIVSGDKGRPTKVCTMSNENLGGGLQMKLVVCVYIVTKTLTYWAEFNYYKLTKSTWLVPWLWVKIRTWWVKRREGCLIEGVIFKVCSTWCTSFSSSETWLLSKLFSLSRASFLVAASISLASSDCTYCTRGGRGL